MSIINVWQSGRFPGGKLCRQLRLRDEQHLAEEHVPRCSHELGDHLGQSDNRLRQQNAFYTLGISLLALLFCVSSDVVAATVVWKIEPTATQAIIRISTDQLGACSYRVSENASFVPLVHDTNTVLFADSNLDTRTGSLIAGPSHTFVLGRRDSEKASDGRLYSRALRANTAHSVGVQCGADTEVIQTFKTQNPPLGQTNPETAPFDSAGFGNYAWPSIDFADPSKIYVDPMTGVGLKRITSPGWTNAKDYENNVFAGVVDLHSAWANAPNISNWPGSGSKLATYSGVSSDPLFAAIDFSTVPDYGYGALDISGWTPGTVMDDILVRTYGFGSDGVAANRTILVCLSTDSGNTCGTQELSVVLPSGSAQTGPTAPANGYPRPAWASWASARPFAGREFGTVITTVTTSGNTITNTGSQSAQFFSRGWKPGGKILVNGSESYTIAAVVNGSTLVTVEPLISHGTAVSFRSQCAGIRFRKQSGTGSISLSAGYDFAASGEFTMPIAGVRALCSPQSVRVTNDADGKPAPARTARLCALPSNATHALVAFFSDNGEARLLSTFDSPAGFQYHAPDWQQYDGALDHAKIYTINDIWDPTVPTRFYTYLTFASGHYALVRVEYTGKYISHKPSPATNGYYRGGTAPEDDLLTYTVVGGYPSQGRGIDQQVAAFGNAHFDPSVWKSWSFQGLIGGVALWAVGPTCCSENPIFIVLQDVNSGNVTKVIDTWSTYPMRFLGIHTAEILDGYFVLIANILGNKGTDVNSYLGGPFTLYPTAVQQNNKLSNDTALSATYADLCPLTIDPQWQALGATGQNCVLIQAKQPCSDYASAAEAAKFPCPWDATKSMLTTVAPGDRFWVEFGSNPQSGETMRIVSTPRDLGAGTAEFWVLRHSERYNNLGGTYGGSGDAHGQGWTAAMIPPEGRTNAAVEIAPDGTMYSEIYAISATHSAIGPGYRAGTATAVMAGADLVTGQPIYDAYGIRWSKALPIQAGKLPDFNLNGNGRFGGEDLGGGAMESYISMQQYQASPSDKRWFLDFHHLNPSSGTGQERYSGVGGFNSAHVPGTAGVVRFTSYPGNNSDIKRFPAMAYAGPNLLRDISGPSSKITDATPWSFCVTYRMGECQFGSAIGDVYTSIPRMDTSGLADGVCIAGWYAQLNPCVMIPHASAGWGMQVDASRPSAGDNHWRKLTQAFSGLGRQYQFGNITSEPDGQWAFVQCYWCDGVRNEIFGIQMPPMPNYDTLNRADFIPLTVQVAAGLGTSARVKFGYAENGPIASLFCTLRQESCVTDTAVAPFAFVDTEAHAPIQCSGGCSINVPGVSGRILYYGIERLNSNGDVISSEPISAAVIP